MRSLPKSHPQKKIGSFSWWKRVPVTARPYSSDAARMTKWLRRLEPHRSSQDVAKLGRDSVPGHVSFFWTECLQNSSLGSSPKPQRLRSTSYRSTIACFEGILSPNIVFAWDSRQPHVWSSRNCMSTISQFMQYHAMLLSVRAACVASEV